MCGSTPCRSADAPTDSSAFRSGEIAPFRVAVDAREEIVEQLLGAAHAGGQLKVRQVARREAELVECGDPAPARLDGASAGHRQSAAGSSCRTRTRTRYARNAWARSTARHDRCCADRGGTGRGRSRSCRAGGGRVSSGQAVGLKVVEDRLRRMRAVRAKTISARPYCAGCGRCSRRRRVMRRERFFLSIADRRNGRPDLKRRADEPRRCYA